MKLVLVRHGESEWNLQNRFTGWVDVDLTEKGVNEAKAAGKSLRYIPVYKTWRLNERHYGALQGLNKAETAKKYGDEQVHIWRRSFDVAPPLISTDDKENYPLFQERYKNIPVDECPRGESLKDTIHRVLPYWDSHISKEIEKGKNVIVAAHGNSLRALIQYLLKIDNKKILELNLPTGKPLIFEINEKLEIISAPELF